MIGKGTLLLIMGFSIIFAIATVYWNGNAVQAVDNYSTYFDHEVSHDLADIGANFACDSIRVDPAKNTNKNSNVNLAYSLPSGTCNVTIQPVNINGRLDYLITSIGSYSDQINTPTMHDTVEALWQTGNFAGYAMFTQNENGVNWITGDVVTGPFATNGQMVIDGAPYFGGRATAVKGVKTGSAGNHATFIGGFQSGSAVQVNVPNDLSCTDTNSTITFQPDTSHRGSNYSYDVNLTFSSDSVVHNGIVTITTTTRQYNTTTKTWTTISTTTAVTDSLKNIADQNGQVVIRVLNGDVHVQGSLTGAVTVLAEAGTGAIADRSFTATNSATSELNSLNGSNANGNIIIEGDMVYDAVTGPQLQSDTKIEKNPLSGDMLGLVAANSVVVDNQTSTSGITVDAAIFCLNGSWAYLDYDGSVSGYPTGPTGKLNVLGSISQDVRGPVGTANSNGTVKTGYVKNYVYDPRYANASPPYFPVANGTWQLVYWYE